MAKRNALGRGLGALLENYDTDVTTKGGDAGEQTSLEGGALVGAAPSHGGSGRGPAARTMCIARWPLPTRLSR